MDVRSRNWSRAIALLLAALVAAAVALPGCGGDDGDGGGDKGDDAQTIQFQKPTDPGPEPFTEPADVEGDREVQLGGGASEDDSGSQQPFGGSGSTRVCDRDKLIRFMRDHPDVMREWARVLGVRPTLRSVRKYIAKLHPVTLTRDTQITNHRLVNGQAQPFQAILQAGTAVLVDKYGTPVVRCFCGNPLRPAIEVPQAKCLGCPAHYRPPPQCRFGRRDDYDDTYYRRDYYSNGDYDEIFIRRHRRSRYGDCYEPYPDPPTVRTVRVFRAPEPEPEPEPTPPPVQPPPTQTAPDEGLHCNPPRSQLEFEQCHGMDQAPPDEPQEPPPATEPPECQGPPPAHPGEDYLRSCRG